MSTHNLCFRCKNKKKMYTPETPQFYYIKLGLRGSILNGHVSVMMFRCASTPMETSPIGPSIETLIS